MKKIHRVLLTFVLSVAAVCGVAKAQSYGQAQVVLAGITGGHDGRTLANKADRTTVAITLGAGLDTVCSGTTIGLSHVLTSAHCIWDGFNGKLKPNLTVVPSYHMAKGHKPAPRFFIENVYIPDNYIQDIAWNGRTSYASSKDIAILQVTEFQNRPYFDEFSHKLRIGSMDQFKLSGQKLSLIGYTDGKMDNSQYVQHETCQTLGRRYNYTAFLHDCDTNPGASGMGMLTADTDGYGTIIGVHTGEAGVGGLNSAAFFRRELIQEIREKVTMYKVDGLEHFRVFNYYDADKENRPYVGYQFRNNCSGRAQLRFFYEHFDGNHYVKGPFEIEPGELVIFPTKTRDISPKYHATVSGRGQINRSHERYVVQGREYGFEKLSFPNVFGDNELVLCG